MKILSNFVNKLERKISSDKNQSLTTSFMVVTKRSINARNVESSIFFLRSFMLSIFLFQRYVKELLLKIVLMNSESLN